MPASDEPLPPGANGTTANGGVCEWVGMEGMEWVGGDREVSVWRWGVWRWSGGCRKLRYLPHIFSHLVALVGGTSQDPTEIYPWCRNDIQE